MLVNRRLKAKPFMALAITAMCLAAVLIAHHRGPVEPPGAIRLFHISDQQACRWDNQRSIVRIWTLNPQTWAFPDYGTEVDLSNMHRRSFTGVAGPPMARTISEITKIVELPVTPPGLANAKIFFSDTVGLRGPNGRVVWLVEEPRPRVWLWVRRLLKLRDPPLPKVINGNEPRGICMYTSQMNGANLHLVAHVTMDLRVVGLDPVSVDRRWLLFTYLDNVYALDLGQ